VAPPLGDGARVSLGQPVDESIRVHGLSGPSHAFVVYRRLAQPDVVRDRAGKEVNVLQDQAEEARSSARSRSRMFTPSTVDAAPLDVVEPQQEIDQRRLAGAGGAHDTDALAWFHVKADIFEDPVVFRARLECLRGAALRLYGRALRLETVPLRVPCVLGGGELLVVREPHMLEHDVAAAGAVRMTGRARVSMTTGSSSSLKSVRTRPSPPGAH